MQWKKAVPRERNPFVHHGPKQCRRYTRIDRERLLLVEPWSPPRDAPPTPQTVRGDWARRLRERASQPGGGGTYHSGSHTVRWAAQPALINCPPCRLPVLGHVHVHVSLLLGPVPPVDHHSVHRVPPGPPALARPVDSPVARPGLHNLVQFCSSTSSTYLSSILHPFQSSSIYTSFSRSSSSHPSGLPRSDPAVAIPFNPIRSFTVPAATCVLRGVAFQQEKKERIRQKTTRLRTSTVPIHHSAIERPRRYRLQPTDD